jgi:hypothetical protein
MLDRGGNRPNEHFFKIISIRLNFSFTLPMVIVVIDRK